MFHNIDTSFANMLTMAGSAWACSWLW